MGIIVDCKTIAKNLKEETKNRVNNFNNKGIALSVSSILVGEDSGSIYYQNSQEKVASQLGINFNKIILPKDATRDDLINIIKKLNDDEKTHGIMLLLPLPKEIDESIVTNAISISKDIDCLSELSVGRFYKGEKSFIPCTPNSVLTILESLDLNLEGKNVVIVGRSNIVGKPVAQLLLQKNATITVCHSRTKNLKDICKNADILIVAIGKPKFINKEYVREDSIVIDVGTSSLNGKITGDVDLDDVLDKVKYITSVPGGVGTLTTTLLLRNVCEALNYED